MCKVLCVLDSRDTDSIFFVLFHSKAFSRAYPEMQDLKCVSVLFFDMFFNIVFNYMRYKTIIAIFVTLMFLCPLYSDGQVAKTIGKQVIKKEVKRAEKAGAKKAVKTVGKDAGKGTARSLAKTAAKSTARGLSPTVVKSMTKEVAAVFSKGGYREI